MKEIADISVSLITTHPIFRARLSNLTANLISEIRGRPHIIVLDSETYTSLISVKKNYLRSFYREEFFLCHYETNAFFYVLFLPDDLNFMIRLLKSEFNYKYYNTVIHTSLINSFTAKKRAEICNWMIRITEDCFNDDVISLEDLSLDEKKNKMGSADIKEGDSSNDMTNFENFDGITPESVNFQEIIIKLNKEMKNNCKTCQEEKIYDDSIKEEPPYFMKMTLDGKKLKMAQKGLKLNGKLLLITQNLKISERILISLSIMYYYRIEWPLLIICSNEDQEKWKEKIYDHILYWKCLEKIQQNESDQESDEMSEIIEKGEEVFKGELFDIEYDGDSIVPGVLSESEKEISENSSSDEISEKTAQNFREKLEKTLESCKKDFKAIFEDKDIKEYKMGAEKCVNKIKFTTKPNFVKNIDKFSDFSCIIFADSLHYYSNSLNYEKTCERIKSCQRLIIFQKPTYMKVWYFNLYALGLCNSKKRIPDSMDIKKNIINENEKIIFFSNYSADSYEYFLASIKKLSYKNFYLRYYNNKYLLDSIEELDFLIDKVSIYKETTDDFLIIMS